MVAVDSLVTLFLPPQSFQCVLKVLWDSISLSDITNRLVLAVARGRTIARWVEAELLSRKPDVGVPAIFRSMTPGAHHRGEGVGRVGKAELAGGFFAFVHTGQQPVIVRLARIPEL